MRREFKMNGVKFRCVPASSCGVCTKGWRIQYFSKIKNAWVFSSSLGVHSTLSDCKEWISEHFAEYKNTSNLFE